MHLPTHALLGWLVAEATPLERRDRLLVLAASLAPDLDALTLLGGRDFYQAWHHVILHNGLAAAAFAALAALAARRRARVGLLAFVAVHLHFLADFVGSAGPDGSLWSIPYLVPFSFHDFYFDGQWGLASWQNVAVTVLAMGACAHLGARRGRTIVEAFSLRADAAVVEVLRRRWPLFRPDPVAREAEEAPATAAPGASSADPPPPAGADGPAPFGAADAAAGDGAPAA